MRLTKELNAIEHYEHQLWDGDIHKYPKDWHPYYDPSKENREARKKEIVAKINEMRYSLNNLMPNAILARGPEKNVIQNHNVAGKEQTNEYIARNFWWPVFEGRDQELQDAVNRGDIRKYSNSHKYSIGAKAQLDGIDEVRLPQNAIFNKKGLSEAEEKKSGQSVEFYENTEINNVLKDGKYKFKGEGFGDINEIPKEVLSKLFKGYEPTSDKVNLKEESLKYGKQLTSQNEGTPAKNLEKPNIVEATDVSVNNQKITENKEQPNKETSSEVPRKVQVKIVQASKSLTSETTKNNSKAKN